MSIPNSRINPLLFASRQAHHHQQQPPPPAPSARPSPHPTSRNLPAFGNPNHFPNPPTHYFPSIPAAARRAAAQASGSSSEEDDERSGGRSAEQRGWNPVQELMDKDEREEMDEGREDTGGAEPVKKRSRTLTTAHQTTVLNALLAKTRFPSTERREEVGQQIGMSARRVQIWFQNRRQSQKRARDREADVPLPSPSSEYPPSDPYFGARYNHPTSLSHQSSRESFTSSHSTLGPGGREHLPTLNEHSPQWAPRGWPGALPTPPHMAAGSFPNGNYFASMEQVGPPVPPKRPSDSSRRSSLSSMTPTTEFVLPPLSTLFPSSAAGPTSHDASRRPSVSGSFTSDRSSRSILSPDDSFSRLRISPPHPDLPQRQPSFNSTALSSPDDVLDAAMSLMQRRSQAPLPPLRYALRASEADAALLAPIRPSSSSSSGGTARLPPLASLALSFPPPQHSSAGFSNQYGQPSPTFSNGPSPTTATFPSLGEWRGSRSESTSGSSYRPGGGRNSGGSFVGNSAGSSRTSLSSEVDWERGYAGAGGERGERKLAKTGREGEKGRGIKGYEVTPWEFEERREGSDEEMG